MPIVKTIPYQSVNLYEKKIWATRSVLLILLLISKLILQAQISPSGEYQLKAVFLFNFTQFVDWPEDSFASEQAPLVIGILGANPFGPFLEETVSGEKVKGHPVIIHQYSNAGEIKNCHILFINIEEEKKRAAIISFLKGRNILTVSEAPDFSKEGGMIRFFTTENKIKLQINPDASREAGLVISSKLLRLAAIFNPKESN